VVIVIVKHADRESFAGDCYCGVGLVIHDSCRGKSCARLARLEKGRAERIGRRKHGRRGR
jgi:hypothetical protein